MVDALITPNGQLDLLSIKNRATVTIERCFEIARLQCLALVLTVMMVMSY